VLSAFFVETFLYLTGVVQRGLRDWHPHTGDSRDGESQTQSREH